MVPSRKHPEPSLDLSSIELPIKIIHDLLWRIHQSNFNAIFFGKTRANRFDAPDRSFGVMYLGLDAYSCFTETFGQQTGNNFVTLEELSKNSIAKIKMHRAVKLIDITGAGLARIRADNRLTTGPHALAQRWAKAIYNHREKVDGLYYRTCHDPSWYSIALFDRLEKSIEVVNSMPLIAKEFSPTLAKILDHYHFALG